MTRLENFVRQYRSGEQGCEMDPDVVQALAQDINDMLKAMKLIATTDLNEDHNSNWNDLAAEHMKAVAIQAKEK